MALARTGFGIDEIHDRTSVEAHLANTVLSQVVDQYGWNDADARSYVQDYLARRGAKSMVSKLCAKYQLIGKEVLEVGSGLGNVLLELALMNVRAVGIEPGAEWCHIIQHRLAQLELETNPCLVLMAYGESLPFADDSFDFIMSMQVLEHVADPEKILREMHRVLRPGGTCFITAPNYFSFAENHYRILWFPSMPRWLAVWYLRARGRNPSFYLNHVNNLTFAKVVSVAHGLSWENVALGRILEKLRSPALAGPLFVRAILRLVGHFGPAGGRAIYWATNFWRPEITYVFQKHNDG